MLDTLASEVELTEREMGNMRQRMDAIDQSIHSQSREIYNPLLRPKMRQYQAILDLAIHELERRERFRGRRPPESEPMRSRRLRSDEDLCGYSSDHRGPVPLENWTTVERAPAPAPVDAVDLRQRLKDRKLGNDQWSYRPAVDHVPPRRSPSPPLQSACSMRSVCVSMNDKCQDGAGPSGLQQIEPRRRAPSPSSMSTDSDDASTGGHPSRPASPLSYRSRSSVASYQSERMQRQLRPRYDVPLPPIRDHNPRQLDRNDPGLIGVSEIYVRRPARQCPYCGEDHRMYRCLQFRALRLLEKWYHALNNGVCLNCLRWGHSSFRCLKEGACRRCGVRHNGLLCPHNRDDPFNN